VVFRNDGDGITVQDRAQVTLTLNSVSDNTGRGIAYLDESDGSARENECARNGSHGVSVAHQAQAVLEGNLCGDNGEAGIRFSGSSGGVARRNIVTGNDLSGIIVQEQAQPTVEKNLTSENSESGIAYFGEAGGVARGNECSVNGSHGISVAGQAQPTLEENTCIQNLESGIVYLESAGGTARGNTCSDNQKRGIEVNGDAAPTLEENVCTGNQHGLYVAETANPELVNNDVRDNIESDIVDQRSSGGSAPPPAQPTQSAELPVSLRQGDARTFDDPPFMIAYANTQHTAPPTAVTIQDSGEGLWRSDGWVSLMQGGQWVEVTHSGTAITSVGVQFWGDTNDGWARVLVDGVERWRGSVYGSDANWPGGAFVKYLQITGLGAGPHTVRVEALGQAGDGSGDDVTVYFFGFE
jgi:parallel beta-helix repeat protein